MSGIEIKEKEGCEALDESNLKVEKNFEKLLQSYIIAFCTLPMAQDRAGSTPTSGSWESSLFGNLHRPVIKKLGEARFKVCHVH